jgi:hypothetical protein
MVPQSSEQRLTACLPADFSCGSKQSARLFSEETPCGDVD